MEYLWKKYEKEIEENKKIISNYKKELNNLRWKVVPNTLFGDGDDFFEERMNLGNKIFKLKDKNYSLFSQKPYNEWASKLSDELLDKEYCKLSKKTKILKNGFFRMQEIRDNHFRLSKNY